MNANTDEADFFDLLSRRADELREDVSRDNEATRHDLLVYPLVTSPFGLGWDPIDLLSQKTIAVPKLITESHIFRSSTPKARTPDILVAPLELRRNVAVIEEKARQQNSAMLNRFRLQLSEYQALFECTWGVLTDGERWILKKNFETFQEFASLDELRKRVEDLRNCIGKQQVITRWRQYQTCDLVVVLPLFKFDIPDVQRSLKLFKPAIYTGKTYTCENCGSEEMWELGFREKHGIGGDGGFGSIGFGFRVDVQCCRCAHSFTFFEDLGK